MWSGFFFFASVISLITNARNANIKMCIILLTNRTHGEKVFQDMSHRRICLPFQAHSNSLCFQTYCCLFYFVTNAPFFIMFFWRFHLKIVMHSYLVKMLWQNCLQVKMFIAKFTRRCLSRWEEVNDKRFCHFYFVILSNNPIFAHM